MTQPTPRTFVIVHGHFYQPPRENPWTGVIERQESAAPQHDWNERITAQCYTPNTRSRVLDGQGRVVQVVNNFEHLSFNFGPTLISYLERAHPDTYRRLLEADRASVRARGFGNAIAQAYNHQILPLASARDRWTQIQWGIADFRARFRREPEGLWLPETAINQATLADLVRAEMKFVLLSPHQAQAISPLHKDDWQDVSAGGIPTDRPYLCRTPHGDLQVLFYQPALSTGVAFEHLLRHASALADRIVAASAESKLAGDRLVMICSDGESYGHHEPFGDMCFAYLATRELQARNLTLTNPAAYLAEHPAQFEVRLKPGPNGEGTAWSCAHGVDRWKRHCGCADGGRAGWTQEWRAPLRAGLDRLRERLDALFEAEGARVLTDPWKARDDYIQVLLGKPLGAAKNFFASHARGALPDEARAQIFRLLEMQRHAMLMYTSCGWFFADLGGLEATQNLKYAARAAQLGALVAGEPVDATLRAELARARSNLPEVGSGLDMLQSWVRPAMFSPEKVAAHHAVLAVVERLAEAERLYQFRVQVHQQLGDHGHGFDATCARLTVTADGTREGGCFDVAALCGSAMRLLAFVRPAPDKGPLPVSPRELIDWVGKEGFEGATRRLEALFPTAYRLADMLTDLREQAVRALLGPLLEELAALHERTFTAHEGLVRSLAPLGLPLPEELKLPAQFAASRRFNAWIERDLDTDDLSRALELSVLMERLTVPLDKRPAARLVAEHLAVRLTAIVAQPRGEPIEAFVALLSDARKAGLPLEEAPLQDQLSLGLKKALRTLLHPKHKGTPAQDDARALLRLAQQLNLNVDEELAQLSGKADAS